LGPAVLFDKSFLQSLSVDESVWFDHFFRSTICPLFYVETLADLEKSVKIGRTPEQEVGIIANKFPEINGTPCLFHRDICISELLGQSIPLDSRVPIGGGRPSGTDGKKGFVYKESPESKAFQRWQKGEFLEIEREYAKSWREALSDIDLKNFEKNLDNLGLSSKNCQSLSDANELARRLLLNPGIQNKLVEIAFIIINVPQNLIGRIQTRWLINGCPPLRYFAPYTLYVLSVEVFFHIAISANLISSERSSNRVDISYLFYLPFCHIFISSDKLHKKCTTYFLRTDQFFQWGRDIKSDLSRLNEYYKNFPDFEKEKGLHKFAPIPPLDENFLICELWDNIIPSWRSRTQKEESSLEDQAKIVDKVKKFSSAPSLKKGEDFISEQDIDFISIERRMRKKKGSWWQLPKDLKIDNNSP
jgi:hypothetical protein